MPYQNANRKGASRHVNKPIKEKAEDTKNGNTRGPFVPGEVYHVRQFLDYGYKPVSPSHKFRLENKKFVMRIKKAKGISSKFHKPNRIYDNGGLCTLMSLHHKSELKKQRLTESQKPFISNSDNNKLDALKKLGITKLVEKFR